VPHSRGHPILGYVLALNPLHSRNWRRRLSNAALPTEDVLLLLSSGGAMLSTEHPTTGSPYAVDPASACTALSSSDDSLAFGSQLPAIVIGGLPSGVGYAARLFACNVDGASHAACLAPENVVLPGCNSTSSVPPNTHGVPAMPAPVTQDEVASLRELRIHTLFVRWTLPEDNQVPIDRVRLAVGNFTWIFDPSVTSYNCTGLPAATQFATNVQAENSLGWGAWSQTSWLSTLPTRPAAPPRPRCDPLARKHDALPIQLDEARPSNGQPVEMYEVRVLLKGECAHDDCSVPSNRPAKASDLGIADAVASGTMPQIYFARRSAELMERNFILTNATVVNATQAAFNITPSTEYIIVARAYNALGWSAWSAPSCAACTDACTTLPAPSSRLSPLVIIIPLGVLLALVIISFFLYWRSNLTKIFAPKMRRKHDKGDPLNEFVSSDMTPMEEQDPELVINPIFIHKIKLDKERARKQKASKGSGLGRTGGLARLNLGFEDKPHVVDERIKDISAVDHYLERERGVLDASKQMSAYEKHQAGKALLKGAKKAQDRSQLAHQQSKVTGLTHAREMARDAARMVGGDEDGQQMSQMGGSCSDATKQNTTAIL